MRKQIAAIAIASMLAAPAFAEPTRVTEMIDKDGQQVSSLNLRYQYDATWRLNASNVLLRNTRQEYVLVTFARPCNELDIPRPATFIPALLGRVYASQSYEVRDSERGAPCDIKSVRFVENRDAARAIAGPAD
jgi:hypothetical protein